MTHTWKSLEGYVRGIAQLRWNAVCGPEHIHGVDFDGVVRLGADEVVLIEITKQFTLAKVREDVHKIATPRSRLMQEGVVCRAFIVLEDEPTDSMKEAGNAAHIRVVSVAAFERDFFDFRAYHELRSKIPFGSAVDAKTGENDARAFISVDYEDVERSDRLNKQEIVARLLRGEQVVLTGDFGTGKSRCVKEVYLDLANQIRDAGAFPLAINLRDHWSSSNALEVLAGHLGNVGATGSVDNLIKLLNSGHLILLLDGFDEIGAQSHDASLEDRRGLRRHAVRGVRDLLSKSRAGALVTGRSHFFDSDEEMVESLGINGRGQSTTILKCPDSFTTEEAQQYLAAFNINTVPDWLPRKPLVFQVLVELDREEVERLLASKNSQYHFWGSFVTAICERESKGVTNAIAPGSIRQILYRMAAMTRYSEKFLGRLTARDIDEAYEAVIGTSPDQVGRQLLLRMCALGRIEPESPDRQFVDHQMVDVLRAEVLTLDILAIRPDSGPMKWKQSLNFLGLLHASNMLRFMDAEQSAFNYLRKFGGITNSSRIAEIVSMLLLIEEEAIDFQGLHISHANVPRLYFHNRTVSNLKITNSDIETMFLDNTSIRENDHVVLDNCIFSLVTGIADEGGLPSWISAAEVINFERVSNAARIKESFLKPQEKLLLAIVHKIFFQPGAGREEAALLKGGYGQRYSPKLVDGILKLLRQEGVVERFKGDDGWVYKPIRRHTERMNRLRSELTLSEDAIWIGAQGLRG